MNKTQFYTYLNKPELLNKASIPELEGILLEYPWFQTAHFLYLKSLYSTGHLKFNKQLRKSATYISDRKALYTFLNSEIPDYKLEELVPKLDEKKKKVEPVKIKKSVRKVEELKKVEIEGKVKSEPKEIDNKVKKEPVEKKVSTKSKKVSNKKKPDLNTKYSFDEWLKLYVKGDELPKEKEIKEVKFVDTEESNLLERFAEPSQNELIDKFIELNPRLENKPGDIREIKDISAKSISDDDGFITETLAKIYIKQKHYERAIQAYQKLSLKYPEKNIYFALQIEKIKKLNNE